MYLKSIFLILLIFVSVLPGQSYVIEEGTPQHAEPLVTSGYSNIAGGVQPQDPNKAEFKQLAEESLEKYLQTNGITKPHKVIEVQKASVQVVKGTLKRIEFTVQPLDGKSGDVIKCNSIIWERLWLNKKEITVDCKINNEPYRAKRQIPGGVMNQDPNDPKFMQLAEESLQKYLQTNGITKAHKVIEVQKASVQVVQGTTTQIEFTVQPLEGKTGDVLKCNSSIWERPWLNKKEITVHCKINN